MITIKYCMILVLILAGIELIIAQSDNMNSQYDVPSHLEPTNNLEGNSRVKRQFNMNGYRGNSRITPMPMYGGGSMRRGGFMSRGYGQMGRAMGGRGSGGRGGGGRGRG